MNANARTMSCTQAEDLGEAKKYYQQERGCNIRRENQTCATMECRDEGLYLCQLSRGQAVSKTPHDELDEASDAFW